jgi:hypothetical protein
MIRSNKIETTAGIGAGASTPYGNAKKGKRRSLDWYSCQTLTGTVNMGSNTIGSFEQEQV